ncbi:RNA polymerase sigma factor [Fulvivirga lutimaris]|uniref:RNA polymerase sigma factor n=1 Tax=Fulvivirga lutimaris TaxID=1819566 RepID=UPI0012BB9CFC|nr:RNA polymerase sigma factor [Fulvivirga lutimaris]MTI40070.1 RNA polymerase sigma factor [Fulvivirga lutimaris]
MSENTSFFDTQEAILQLKAGDEATFKDLVLKFQNKVFNVCVGMLKNSEEAEDLAQEVFVEIFRNIDQFNAEAKLSTWIYRIAVNKSLEHIRYNKRQKRFAWLTSLFGADEDLARNYSDFYHPGVALENKERAKVLHDAIDKLAENQKAAFVMHKMEGLSYQEIAEIMQLSLSSVESLMHRAKKRLRELLNDFYKNDS